MTRWLGTPLLLDTGELPMMQASDVLGRGAGRGPDAPAVGGGVPRRDGRVDRRWPRRALWALLAIFVLGVGYVGFTFFQVWSTSHRRDDTAAQAIIVMGAAQYNGEPSPVLRARLQQALDLYDRKLAPLIVVTGGRQPGDRYTEATTGYDWLRARGVPDAAILKEVHGGSSWEELKATARFLHARGIDHVLLVSDSYHSLRLLQIAGEVDLHAEVSPTTDHLPAGTQAKYLLRETAAVAVGRIVGYHLLDRR
jgi:uncharacterized SAM-binding protein YcdF (DUF218 family)